MSPSNLEKKLRDLAAAKRKLYRRSKAPVTNAIALGYAFAIEDVIGFLREMVKP